MIVSLVNGRTVALLVTGRDRRYSVVGVGLHCLLECSHFLDSQNLATPLLVYGLALLSFQSKLLSQLFLPVLQLLDLTLQLLYLLTRLLILFTLQPVYSFE